MRRRAGLFDLSHMGELWVDGPGAGDGLAARARQRPDARSRSGRAQYSMICAADGGIIDDLIVYRVGPERFLVVPNAANAAVVAAAMRRAARRLRRDARRRVAAHLAHRRPGPARAAHPGAADGRGPRRRCATTPSPPGTRRGRRPGSRAPATPARTASSCSSPGPDAPGGLGRAASAGRRGRPRAVRPGRPRHAPAGGGHAALRQRARPRHAPRSRPAWAAWSSWTSPATSSAARRSSGRSAPVPRKLLVGFGLREPRHRPPRLPGPPARCRRSPAAWSPAAPCRRRWACPSPWPTCPRRDGRAGYHGRGRHPRLAHRGRGRPAALLPSPGLSRRAPTPSTERSTAWRSRTVCATPRITSGCASTATRPSWASPPTPRMSWATSSSWSCRRSGAGSAPGEAFGVIESVKTASDLYCARRGRGDRGQRGPRRTRRSWSTATPTARAG